VGSVEKTALAQDLGSDPECEARLGVCAAGAGFDAGTGPEADAGPPPVWPMFRRDSSRQGRSPFVGAQAGVKRWEFATGDVVDSSPAIGADGTVYVGSADFKVYAIGP
jgi:hypothetical protein